MGLDISRCFEYMAAYKAISGRKTVLDIGSYRSPLPLFLASEGFQILSIDTSDVLCMQRRWAVNAGLKRLLAEGRFQISLQDARYMGLADESVDCVTCISTLEHIPGDGDIQVMKEIYRVLKPGGVAFISVPFSQTYKEGRWNRWFQREYDYEHLLRRLIEGTGLELKDIGYLLGPKARRFADLLYKLPRLIRHALGWSQILPALYLLPRDSATERNARIVWVLMEKKPTSPNQNNTKVLFPRTGFRGKI